MIDLAWRAVVLILGVTFLVMFRSEIRAFLSRVQGVSKSGISTAPTQPPATQTANRSSADDLLKKLDSVTLRGVIERVVHP